MGSRPLGEAELAVFDRVLPYSHAQIQRISASVTVLQAQRSRVAAAAAEDAEPSTEICAVGQIGINRWLMNTEHDWREILSVRPWGRVEELRVSVPLNRRTGREGLRMVSIFDHDGTTPEARLMLAAETAPPYRLAPAPLQMKIIDRSHVLLDGPILDDEPTIMMTGNTACVAAAHAYWRAALDASIPAATAAVALPGLTDRQRQVVALLSADITDEQIARTLDVSVRTVRGDIARVMATLGVQSRFSLGRAISEHLEA